MGAEIARRLASRESQYGDAKEGNRSRSRKKRGTEAEDEIRESFLTERVAIVNEKTRISENSYKAKILYLTKNLRTFKGNSTRRVVRNGRSGWISLENGILGRLLDKGHSPLATQWIEADQNEHLKRPGEAHEINTKSRLVACGEFEKTDGIKADSPTCPVEGLNIVCSFAVCKKRKESKQGL